MKKTTNCAYCSERIELNEKNTKDLDLAVLDGTVVEDCKDIVTSCKQVLCDHCGGEFQVIQIH